MLPHLTTGVAATGSYVARAGTPGSRRFACRARIQRIRGSGPDAVLLRYHRLSPSNL